MALDRGAPLSVTEWFRRLSGSVDAGPHFDDVDATIRELYVLLDDAIKWPGWTARDARYVLFLRWLYATGRLTD